jgi:hypothetical protein
MLMNGMLNNEDDDCDDQEEQQDEVAPPAASPCNRPRKKVKMEDSRLA